MSSADPTDPGGPALSALGFPDAPWCRAALGTAREHLSAAILHHSLRTFLHAERAATGFGLRAGGDYAREELFVACALHDLGTADRYDGPQRFEVEGADAAAELLSSWGAPGAAAQRVWEAVALHTSPGIAERMAPLTRLTRAGVVSDFTVAGGQAPSGMTAPERARIEALLPRLDVEQGLGDAVTRQALRNPAKAPRASWPGALLQAHLADPHHPGVNPAF